MTQEECSVCLEDLSIAAVSKLSCGHSFHCTCASTWLQRNPTCPLCRTRVHMTVSELLQYTQVQRLLGITRARGGASTRRYIRIAFQETHGSIYLAAVNCGKKAVALSDSGPSGWEAFREELAFMLVYLHLGGDCRAAQAASETTTEGAWRIACGLSDWAGRASQQGPPRVARRRWF